MHTPEGPHDSLSQNEQDQIVLDAVSAHGAEQDASGQPHQPGLLETELLSEAVAKRVRDIAEAQGISFEAAWLQETGIPIRKKEEE